jgi:hypothetical protein
MSKHAAKNYCITLNNYSPIQYEAFKLFTQTYCKYAIAQLEIGESGTPHIQGYFQLKEKKKLTWLKNNLFQEAHYEGARGSASANREYCSKAGGTEPYEFGEPIESGTRTDLKAFTDRIIAGESVSTIAAEQPEVYVKYSRGLDSLAARTSRGRDFKTRVLWFWGPTGSGKSREAFEKYPDAYWKEGTTKWWDGYDGVGDVIVDDYRRDLCTFAQLLRLFDRYPVIVETKGGSLNFRPRTIVITTPKDPRATWEGRTSEDIAQLIRRIDEIREFRPDHVPEFPIFAPSYKPLNPYNLSSPCPESKSPDPE